MSAIWITYSSRRENVMRGILVDASFTTNAYAHERRLRGDEGKCTERGQIDLPIIVQGRDPGDRSWDYKPGNKPV